MVKGKPEIRRPNSRTRSGGIFAPLPFSEFGLRPSVLRVRISNLPLFARLHTLRAVQVLLSTTRNWHLEQTARAFSQRGVLAGFWMADKNSLGIPAGQYRRCWPYHLAMKPFYHFAPQIWDERATYWFVGLYERWLQGKLRSTDCPKFEVAHGLMGFATELFAHAQKTGALKVLDCPNSHPTTYFGFWQRECDLWCPGEEVPIPRWMFGRMNRELELADLVIVQSRFARESMVLNGIPETKVLLNPMGVDTTLFKKREAVPAKPRFISVGTISLRKGHQYLFRAFELVKRKLPEAELLCVGRYKCDFRKEKPKWAGSFTHHPELQQSEVAALLRGCTAFVFPSQEEGIARAQVEALASGLPVVGTHEGGATTLVEDGKEGLIVRGRDPQHIAEAMLKLASDPELNRRMGEAAYTKGALRNTWQDYGERLLAEYARRIGKPANSYESARS
jgi:glycosyltransferase involved in cell wall biosynthesis